MTLNLVCPQNLWCSACWKQVGGRSHSPGEVIEQGCGCLQGSLRALRECTPCGYRNWRERRSLCLVPWVQLSLYLAVPRFS